MKIEELGFEILGIWLSAGLVVLTCGYAYYCLLELDYLNKWFHDGQTITEKP